MYSNMKIDIITRHAITNYGSLLQTIAMQKIVKKLGYECEIIDYIRNDEHYRKCEVTLLNNKPEWRNNVLKKMIYLALRQPESIIAGRQFEKEREKYLQLTKRYSTLGELRSDPPKADVYITGSDQVWGPMANGVHDSAYCLNFTPASAKKVAYAASFGRTELTDELKAYYKKYISGYAHVAVREDSAIDMLMELGIKSEQVLDPTLLVSADEWEEYLSPIKDQNYMLVYQLHNDEKLSEYASRAAKKAGIPLVRISASLHQILRGGKFRFLPTIGEFLSYIKNARCLVTDSFHGTAFAINFNTPFIEVLPNNNTCGRNMSILKLTNLTDRILSQYDDFFNILYKKTDYKDVNRRIEIERQKSIKELSMMIEH